MGVQDSSSDFVISHNSADLLRIDHLSGEVEVKGKLKVQEELQLGLNGQFRVNGVNQWIMVHEEDAYSLDL